MIDYFKAVIIKDTNEIRNNSLLNFVSELNHKTALLSNEKADYNCLKFEIKGANILQVSGSLHKYYNRLKGIKAPNQKSDFEISKGFNGNDLNLNEIQFALKDLQNNFNLPLNELIIQNLEFGLNIEHSFDTNKILSGLMSQKSKEFTRPLENTYRQAVHQQYILKVYDKSLQYGMQKNVIRIECKYRKSQPIQKTNIKTLADLNKTNLIELFKDLTRKFNDTILFDYTIKKDALNKKQIIKLKDYSNPNYWNKQNKQNKYRNLKKMNELIKLNSNNIKTVLINKMIDKFIELN